MTLAALLKKPQDEYQFFLLMPRDTRVLLVTNMIYAFVLPVIEIFVGAYIMRSSNDPSIVAVYQLTVYTGIPITFLINGFLLSRIKISSLYSFGMLLSGLSMLVMMSLENLSVVGVGVAGILMGCSFGFFWSNRDFLALNTTNDSNRNYYYGLETFFYTITFILVPLVVGAFLATADTRGWFEGNMNNGYQIVTVVVFLLTILSSVVIHKEKFQKSSTQAISLFQISFPMEQNAGTGRSKRISARIPGHGSCYSDNAYGGQRRFTRIGARYQRHCNCCDVISAGRTTKPEHRIYIFSVGLVIFLMGTLANGILFSAFGVMIFVLCKVLFQPLHDIAYFPIQMRVIDVVSKIENRNEFTYIFNHEFGLYVGRFLGLGLFIYFATYISESFALKYSLIVIAIVQLASIPLARHIVKESYKLSKV